MKQIVCSQARHLFIQAKVNVFQLLFTRIYLHGFIRYTKIAF